MSDNNNSGDGGGALLIILFVAAVIFTIAIATIMVGAFYGGGKAIYNYTKAFRNNVAFEKSLPAS